MNTKKKEMISEWMSAIAKGMISVGCFGVFLKYVRETWWAVENAMSVPKWFIEGPEFNPPPQTEEGGVNCEPASEN